MTSLSMPQTAGVPHRVAHSAIGLATIIRCAGMLVAVAALFTAAANWGWDAGRLPAPPLAFMLLVFAASGAASLLDGLRGASMPLVAWACANAVMAMTAFIWSSGSDDALQEVQTRILSSMLLVSTGVMLFDPVARRVTRIATAMAMLFSVGLNIWEVTHPLTFSMALGRSAGFYVNPNIAGAAIITGMLVGLPSVPARLREAFVLVAGIGVFTTLSRGALLCWLLVVTLLVCYRGVRGVRVAMISTVAGIAGVSLAAALLASGHLSYIGGGAERFVRQRLNVGSKEELGADVSASSRSHLVMRSLEMFAERPFTGHGTGATVEWKEPESTHNVYARQLAEYGAVGAWLAPALLLIAWRSARRRREDDSPDMGNGSVLAASSTTLVIFVACWGVFSHNVFDDPFILIAIALVVATDAHASATARVREATA